MIVRVPASVAVLEFYNHDHAGDGSGVFSKPNGTYRKGGANKGRGYPKKGGKVAPESGKYDDSGNEHVGVNISDNANRQAKDKKAADTKKFTDAANKIAKRDGISPGEAAKRLGHLLSVTPPRGLKGPR